MLPTATASQPGETEEILIQTAQRAISQCRWIVGECASKWTQRHARGRTDAEFGQLVGLSGDQIYQRRRVWETFSDVREQFAALKWSHYYAALNWDDAAECLQWAEETQSTVAEMKAWRRALRGEDLTSEPEAAELSSEHVSYLSGERAYVQDPAGMSSGEGARRPGMPTGMGSESDPARMTALARELDPLAGDNYAPFHAGAVHPPATETAGERPNHVETITPEQLAKRLCSTIERCNKALDEDVLEQLDKLPGKLRQRLMTAVEELHDKLAALNA